MMFSLKFAQGCVCATYIVLCKHGKHGLWIDFNNVLLLHLKSVVALHCEILVFNCTAFHNSQNNVRSVRH